MMKITRKILFGALTLGAIFSQGCTQMFKLNFKPTVALKGPKNPGANLNNPSTKISDYDDAPLVALGDQALGEEKLTATYGISNTGDFPLTIKRISVSNPFEGQIKVLSNCQSLAANESEVCPITFVFDPKTVGTFQPEFNVVIENNFGEIKTFSFPVEGRGLAIAVLKIFQGTGGANPPPIPAEGLDFGQVSTTTPKEILVQIKTNTDDFAPDVNAATNVRMEFSSQAGAFQVNTTGLNTNPNTPPCDLASGTVSKDCFIKLQFRPSQAQRYEDGFRLRYSNGSSSVELMQVALKGAGVISPPEPTLFFADTHRQVELFLPDQQELSLPVKVQGSGSVYFDSITSSAPDRVEVLQTSACTLVSGAEIFGGCAYLPKAFSRIPEHSTGPFTSTITLNYRQSAPTGSLKSLTATISGTVKNYARLAFNPNSAVPSGIPSYSFNTVSIYESQTADITVTNISTAPTVNATKMLVSYGDSLETHPITAKFAPECSVLEPGKFCTLKLTFAPTVAGTANRTIRISYNNRGLTGTDAPSDIIASLSVSGAADETLKITDGGGSLGTSNIIKVGDNLGNFVWGSKTGNYFGWRLLKFAGTGKLTFKAEFPTDRRFAFYSNPNISFNPNQPFPGIRYPYHDLKSPQLCSPNFVIGSSNPDGTKNTSCLFYLGIKDTMYSDDVRTDEIHRKNLKISVFNGGTAPVKTLDFVMETTPRDPPVLGYVSASSINCNSVLTKGTLVENRYIPKPDNVINFDSTIKNILSTKSVYLCLAPPAYSAVSLSRVEFGTVSNGQFTKEDNGVFSNTRPIFPPTPVPDLNDDSSCRGRSGIAPSTAGGTNSISCPVTFSFVPSASSNFKKIARIYYADGTNVEKSLDVLLDGTGYDLNKVVRATDGAADTMVEDFGVKYAPGTYTLEVPMAAIGHSVAGPLQIVWPSTWTSASPFSLDSSSSCLTTFSANVSTSSGVQGAGYRCTLKFQYKPTQARETADEVKEIRVLYKNALIPNWTSTTGYNGMLSLNLKGTLIKLNPSISLSGVTGSASTYTLERFQEVLLNQDGGVGGLEKTFTIANAPNPTGGNPTRGDAKAFAFTFPSGSAYSLSRTSCPGSGATSNLAPNASCTVTVKFNPQVPIQPPGASDVLIAYQNAYGDAQTPIKVNLSGSARSADPISVEASLAFGSRILGADNTVASESKELILTNTSTDANPITAKNISFGPVTSPFLIDADSAKSTCLASAIKTNGLLPGSKCKFLIQFSPGSDVRQYNQRIVLTYKDSGSSTNSYQKQIDLSGGVVKGARVFAGATRTCVINGMEQAFCFGDNSRGALGVGNNSTFLPTSVTLQTHSSSNLIQFGSTPSIVRDLSVGTSHVCAIVDYPSIQALGLATCWGSGANGKLGKGNLTDFNKPELNPAGSQVSSINFGTGTDGQALRVVQISAGDQHTCALLSNGKIKCFGANAYGKLGSGGDSAQILGDDPSELGNNLPVVSFDVPNLIAIHVSAAVGHSCATFSNGSARCWGWNFYGQLGQEIGQGGFGSTPGSDFQPMSNLRPINLGFLAAKTHAGFGGRTCAVSQDGNKIKCFGKTLKLAEPQIGQFAGLLGVCLQRSGSALSPCTGTVKPAGGVGWSTGDMSSSHLSVNFGTGLSVTDLAVGDTFTCAILSDRSVKCFGYDDWGQLGLDVSLNNVADTTRADPGLSIAVPAPGVAFPTKIAAGANHACVVTSTNELKCWGDPASNATGTKTEAGLSDLTKIGSASAVRTIWKQP